jgi:hypothetical protein
MAIIIIIIAAIAKIVAIKVIFISSFHFTESL